jgi:hypothetical protein
MLTLIPNDLLFIIINLLELNDIFNLRLINKQIKKYTKSYSPNYNILINKSLIFKLFPNIKSISIKNNIFKYLYVPNNSALKILEIDNNHNITDQELQKLMMIEQLYIYNCGKITHYGIYNLVNIDNSSILKNDELS